MDSEKLITIAIAAAIGALVKELFTALIKHSATTAKKLVKAAPSLIKSHWESIDFFLTIFGILYLLFIFFFLDRLTGLVEITHSVVRIYVFLGIMIIWQLFSLFSSIAKRIQKKQNKSEMATPRKPSD